MIEKTPAAELLRLRYYNKHVRFASCFIKGARGGYFVPAFDDFKICTNNIIWINFLFERGACGVFRVNLQLVFRADLKHILCIICLISASRRNTRPLFMQRFE